MRFPKRSGEQVNFKRLRPRPWLLLVILSMAIPASATWKEKVGCLGAYHGARVQLLPPDLTKLRVPRSLPLFGKGRVIDG
jgi:hypothetical protein